MGSPPALVDGGRGDPSQAWRWDLPNAPAEPQRFPFPGPEKVRARPQRSTFSLWVDNFRIVNSETGSGKTGRNGQKRPAKTGRQKTTQPAANQLRASPGPQRGRGTGGGLGENLTTRDSG